MDRDFAAHQGLAERLSQLERAVEAIDSRNRRVELEKAWETSLTRRLLLLGLTYLITALVFWKIAVPAPYANALIPTTGYFISTLTLPWARQLWMARQGQRRSA